jgi:hypothetical protein
MRLLLLFMAFCTALPCPAQNTSAGKELFVAVGYGGRRMSSPDGVQWQHEQRWSDEAKDDENVLFNVAYGLGRFIAVGGGAKVGHILSTVDGRQWTALPQVRGRVATIAFGNNRFVAGHDAELLYSTDGVTFQAGQKLDWKASVHARKSAFGDGEGGAMFVIIGDVDFQGETQRVHYRATTSDGVRYASATRDSAPARDIAYGSGHFVVVGPNGLLESSHDGQNWTKRSTDPTEDFESVVWTGTRFLAKGRRVWSSEDGLHWVPQSLKVPGSLAWARDGVGGIGFSWGGNVFYASPDLQTWRKATLPPGPSFTAVARRTE